MRNFLLAGSDGRIFIAIREVDDPQGCSYEKNAMIRIQRHIEFSCSCRATTVDFEISAATYEGRNNRQPTIRKEEPLNLGWNSGHVWEALTPKTIPSHP